MTGAIVSDMTLTEALPLLSATSVALPLDVPCSSVNVSELPLQAFTPDNASSQLQEAVTGLVYQPLLPCVPVMAGVTVGAVLSTLTVTVAVAVLPEPSVMVPVWSLPSTDVSSMIGVGCWHELTPAYWLLQLQFTTVFGMSVRYVQVL